MDGDLENPIFLMENLGKNFVTLLTQYFVHGVNKSATLSNQTEYENSTQYLSQSFYETSFDSSFSPPSSLSFIFQLILSMSWNLIQNPIFCAGMSMVIVTFCFEKIKAFFVYCYDYICSFFIYTIEVGNREIAFRYLEYWLSKQPFTQNSKYSRLKCSWDHAENGGYTNNNRNHFSDDENDENEKPHMYIISRDNVRFMYKNRLVWVCLEIQEKKQETIENYIFSTFSTSKDVLLELFKEATDLYFKKDTGKVIIRVANSGSWREQCSRDPRELDSVVLPTGTKEKIIKDIEKFHANTEWYNRTGIPRKRGYLLYGPPGTGKTSLILALASKFKMGVCLLSLSSSGMDDESLSELFNSAPKNTLMLMEDVDAAFPKRKNNGINKKNKEDDEEKEENMFSQASGNVTFSGLLNVLDGIATQPGRIVFMTTNYIDRLDSALIRPGRVDLKVKIDYATREQIGEIYKRFFPEHKKEVNGVADLFPNEQLTPAEIQSLFMEHQDTPNEINETIVQKFLNDCLLTRKIYKKKQEETDSSFTDNEIQSSAENFCDMVINLPENSKTNNGNSKSNNEKEELDKNA